MRDGVTTLWVSFFVAVACVVLAAGLTLRSHHRNTPVYRAVAVHTVRVDAGIDATFPLELMKVRAMTQLGWDEEQASTIREVWRDRSVETRAFRLVAEGSDPVHTAYLANAMVAQYMLWLMEYYPNVMSPLSILESASPPAAPYDEHKPVAVVLNAAVAGLAGFMVSVLVLMRKNRLV